MDNPRPSFLARVFRGIDFSRRLVLNLIFLFVLVLLLAMAGSGAPKMPSKAVLVIDPQGNLVEQLGGDPLDRAVAKALDNDVPQTLVYDVLDALHAAKSDDRIVAVLLDLNNLAGGSLEKLEHVAKAIDEVKASGKKVLATSDFYSDTSYYLAAHADEVYLHEQGMVLFDGYERFGLFHKSLIDKLEIDWNVFRVGEYKSAVEPFLRDDMSPEAEQANLAYLQDLWAGWLADVAKQRKLQPADLQRYVDELAAGLASTGGDSAKLALNSKLVDQVGQRDLLRDKLVELAGEDKDNNSFQQVDLEDYLKAVGDKRNRYKKDGDGVAVIVAAGAIVDGSAPPGAIGGESTAALLRQARKDDDVKAIVLRVDSGGGSAFASEVIRRECELARAAGKKVVISMGGVAASGGYWISTSADEIWASPNTITGSIGIFGMFPTFQKPLAKYLGTYADGVGTTWLSGTFRTDRAMDPKVGELIQTVINRGYQEFLQRVSKARNMPTAEVDKIARGRVWSGTDAKGIGLVDQLGGLEEAIASAAKLAALEEGYAVKFIEKEASFTDQLLTELLTQATALAGPLGVTERPVGIEKQMIDAFAEHRAMLGQFSDPRGVYAHCLCEVR
jgi:protease-4